MSYHAFGADPNSSTAEENARRIAVWESQKAQIKQQNDAILAAWQAQVKSIGQSNASRNASYSASRSSWLQSKNRVTAAYESALAAYNKQASAYSAYLKQDAAVKATIKTIGDNYIRMVNAAAAAEGINPNVVTTAFGSRSLCISKEMRDYFTGACTTSTTVRGLGAILTPTQQQLLAKLPGMPCFLKRLPLCTTLPTPPAPVAPPGTKPVVPTIPAEPKPPTLTPEPPRPTLTPEPPPPTLLTAPPPLPPPVARPPAATTPPAITQIVSPPPAETAPVPAPGPETSGGASVVGILALMALVAGGGLVAYHVLRKPKARQAA